MLAVHRKEMSLILWAALFFGAGLLNLWFIDNQRWHTDIFTYGGILVVLLLAISLLLARWKIIGDPYILPLIAMLNFIGMLLLFRLSPDVAVKQFYWQVVGLLSFVFVIKFLADYVRLQDYKYVYIIVGILLLVLTIIFGVEVGGAKSWLALGPLRFQPSEIVKIILVVFLASFLEEERDILVSGSREILGIGLPSLRYIGPVIIMCGLSLMLLVFQKDLGTALIFYGTFLAMVYIATGRWLYITSGTFLFALGAVICYFLFFHVQTRVAIWLNPWQDIDGKGYQIVQSLFALASGGLTGTGLGLGNPGYIPAVHTDFVFSAWSEETGMLGAVALILLYLLFVYRGMVIAAKSRTNFGILLAGGLSALFAIQTFVIMAGVIKFLPLTGVTLPFISYGGSSLVSSYVLAGLLVAVSHRDSSVSEGMLER
ncbi:FtsW/RodA/SpoVE family cell cycle protein [Thermincola ferriacetica]